MAKKIEIQKGKVEVNNPTMKMKSYEQNRREAKEMSRERKDGQTLKYHSPKR